MGTNNKPFRGRAIYQPSGAAGEYSQWACNLFNGCSNRCDYCYNRHSMTAKVLGADEVTIKKQLLMAKYIDDNGDTQMLPWDEVVLEEIGQNSEQIIRDGGLFLSFVSDPLLERTAPYTKTVLEICWKREPPIPVTILTKSAWWLDQWRWHDDKYLPCVADVMLQHKDHLQLGFTLTGMEYMERHCISNTQERIDAMKWAREQGLYTWASIEPVIDYQMALDVITRSLPFCREYRIGLASKLGIKYDPADVLRFKRA